MFRLDGQVAIITGGARGIRVGICKVFINGITLHANGGSYPI